MSSVPGRGNTSKKPDGKPQGQLVSFTRGAADRIAKVVRTVERGDTGAEGLRFGRPPDNISPFSVRFAFYTATTNWTVATITAATTTNNTKVIQLAFPTTTPFVTALCVNHMAPMPLVSTNATAATQIVLASKEAGFYRLIGAGA